MSVYAPNWEHILACQELRTQHNTKKMVARLDLGWRAECQAELRPSIGSNGGHPYVHHEDENEQFRKIRLITAILEKSLVVDTTISPEISSAQDGPV
jgi:hypothetical protein